MIQWLLVAQSCLTLCDLTDCSAPGSSVHTILQARRVEWVAIPFSRASSWPRDQTQISWIGRQILYRLSHHGRPYSSNNWSLKCIDPINCVQTSYLNVPIMKETLIFSLLYDFINSTCSMKLLWNQTRHPIYQLHCLLFNCFLLVKWQMSQSVHKTAVETLIWIYNKERQN